MEKKDSNQTHDIYDGLTELIDLVKMGDMDAYEEIFNRYFPYLKNKFLSHIFPSMDDQDREDIAIHVLLRVLYKIRKCENRSNLESHGWICKIAKRLGYDFYRNSGNKTNIKNIDDILEESLSSNKINTDLLLSKITFLQMLGKVDITEQEFIFLKLYLEGMKQKDMMPYLEVNSPERVSQIKKKLIEKIRNIL